jgi:nucleotide-binding universal stress UspA family protein
MSSDVIVSYDGTPNDDDALTLGRALSRGGESLALAYVRHSRVLDPRREELAQHDAERRLGAGIDLLGDPAVTSHVLFNASTNEGLELLARERGAGLIVFGSDYRTAPGRAEPGNTAQRLLDGGPLAIAVARAGLRLSSDEPLATITAANPGDDPAVGVTVDSIAERLGLIKVDPDAASTDLIVVGSQPGATPGTLALSGSARAALNTARGSVLVLARERPLAV